MNLIRWCHVCAYLKAVNKLITTAQFQKNRPCEVLASNYTKVNALKIWDYINSLNIVKKKCKRHFSYPH